MRCYNKEDSLKLILRSFFGLKIDLNQKSAMDTETVLNFIAMSSSNGEFFENRLSELLGWDHNNEWHGDDAYGVIKGERRAIEYKTEKRQSKKFNGNSKWSIHCEETLLKKQDKDLFLMQSGMKDGKVVYMLGMDLNKTTILDSSTIKLSDRKISRSWTSYKNAPVEVYFRNEELITTLCPKGFRDWIFDKSNSFKSTFGFDLEDALEL